MINRAYSFNLFDGSMERTHDFFILIFIGDVMNLWVLLYIVIYWIAQ